MKLLLPLAFLIALSPVVARADDMAGMNHSHMNATNPTDKAFMDSMERMMKGMNVKPTGDADRDFVVMMNPHHQGAVDMAKIELQYGKDPELRKLAESIVSAQEKEIAMMKSWLATRKK